VILDDGSKLQLPVSHVIMRVTTDTLQYCVARLIVLNAFLTYGIFNFEWASWNIIQSSVSEHLISICSHSMVNWFRVTRSALQFDRWLNFHIFISSAKMTLLPHQSLFFQLPKYFVHKTYYIDFTWYLKNLNSEVKQAFFKTFSFRVSPGRLFD
jgi:hypothetical protein